MAIPLGDLALGQRGTITAIASVRGLGVRLLEMGLVPGTAVRLVKRAPLGDPLELELRGYHLSVRAADAAHVTVVPLDRTAPAADARRGARDGRGAARR
jgi:ferrous iron transport protein A